MRPQQARAEHGATHYTTMTDGVTPQMYYRWDWLCPVQREVKIWHYLSYAGMWMGSAHGTDNMPAAFVTIGDEEKDHAGE